MHRSNALIEENVHMLKQGIDLVERLDRRLYGEVSHTLLKYTAGGHFRHCIDFYNCFLSSVAAGRINYDRRERNELVEMDRAFAVAEMEDIIERLRRLPITCGNEEVEIILEDPSAGADETRWSRSSIMRELQFLVSHTIHHYALIAIALRLQGFEPDEEFGVSLSTLQHWQQTSGMSR